MKKLLFGIGAVAMLILSCHAANINDKREENSCDICGVHIYFTLHPSAICGDNTFFRVRVLRDRGSVPALVRINDGQRFSDWKYPVPRLGQDNRIDCFVTPDEEFRGVDKFLPGDVIELEFTFETQNRHRERVGTQGSVFITVNQGNYPSVSVETHGMGEVSMEDPGLCLMCYNGQNPTSARFYSNTPDAYPAFSFLGILNPKSM